MKKSCCIDDVNVSPRSSSYSMVLRSACSHGHHSPKPLTANKFQNQESTSINRKSFKKYTVEKESNSSSAEKSEQLDIYLRSSLKQLAFRSAKTYSVLKESLYCHLDYSKTARSKSLQETETHSEIFGEEYGESKSRGLFINNNSISQEECSYINNNCIASSYSTVMSKPPEFSRSSAVVNALSDSENEESSLKDNLRKRRSTRSSVSRSSTVTESHNSHAHSNYNSVFDSNSVNSSALSRNEKHFRVASFNFNNHSNSNSNYHTPTSSILYKSNNNHSPGSEACSTASSPSSPSVIDISTVQYTPIDRFRWFLWRSIYLKIIKCVNFDVWVLSRLRKYRTYLLLLLMLPILFYLLYGAFLRNSLAFDGVKSNVNTYSSYIYSFSSLPYDEKTESASNEKTCSDKASDVLSILWRAFKKFILSVFLKIKQALTVYLGATPTVHQTKTVFDKEELKSIALEVERLKKVVISLKDSSGKPVPILKDDGVKKIQDDLTNLRLEFKSLIDSVKKLEKDVNLKSDRVVTKYTSTIEDQNAHILSINTRMKTFEEKLSDLSVTLKICCDQKWTISDFAASFEKYFLLALKNVVEKDGNRNSPYFFFSEWLQSKLTTDREKLSQELKSEFEKMKGVKAKYDETSQTVVENVVKKYMESMRKDLNYQSKASVSADSTLSLGVVQTLIKEAIMLYDADKTGRVDYALESGGGSVLSTRCSESYAEKDGTVSVLGIPLWSTHNSPRTTIQPDIQPGQCWAFKGSQGYLVIQLSYTIHPTGFTLEHIPVSLSPAGSIDSAPKEFSVWGMLSEKDNEGKLLGIYSYDQNGDPLQYFAVQNSYPEPFSFVELKILSNWGNLEYTCLYRFRVHGKLPKL